MSTDKKVYVVLRIHAEPGRGNEIFTSARAFEVARWGELEVGVEELDGRELGLLARDRDVAAVAERMTVRLIEPTSLGDDTVSPRSGSIAWGIRAVGADTSPFTGAGVKVAVLDTGIDASHPAFAGVNLVESNFTDEADAGDWNGHGTHCSGTIFGRDVDRERIGVARGIETVLIGKVLDRQGRGTTEGVLRGLLWAEERGASVISISLGLDFPALVKRLTEIEAMPAPAAVSEALETYRKNLRLFDAVARFFQARATIGRGALVCAAAGNESDRGAHPPYRVHAAPPAASEGYLAVAALCIRPEDPSEYAIAPFSNLGADLAAPGVGVRSARLHGGVRALSGTSMAAPHVAGVAALWAERQIRIAGRIVPDHVRTQLEGNTQVLRGLDPDEVGQGLATAPQEAI